MISYFKKQIEEIELSPALKYYFYFLFAIHLLTVYFWSEFSFRFGAVCWPGLEGCKSISNFVQLNWNIFLGIYLAITISGIIFLYRKRTDFAYVVFLFLFLLKYGLQLTDFRLMGNYHYMAHVVSLAFLFLSNKANVIRLFIVLFYFTAGCIKFNTDWLSGAALLQVPMFTGYWLQWSLIYVIVLEMVFVFLLLSGSTLVRWFALLQLILFHIFSYHIVGYFYPAIMGFLLTGFVLFKTPFSFSFKKPAIVCFSVFLLAQFYVFVFEPKSSLNGRGRILSLNMLDARTQCMTQIFVRYESKTIEYEPKFDQFGVRIQCDPVLVFDRAKAACRSGKLTDDFIDVDLVHLVRRVSNTNEIEKIQIQDFCAKSPHIGFLGGVNE